MRIVYLSDIGLNENTGGSRVMTAHLCREDSPEMIPIGFEEVSDSYRLTIRGRIAERLKRTRYNELVKSWEPRMLDFSPRPLVQKIRQLRPDLVLTVAHGISGTVAEHICQIAGLPLATIFHDWWPFVDQRMRGVNASRRTRLEAQFKRLYQNSDTAFCVCQGMKDELGQHRNAKILYPMPNSRPRDSGKVSNNKVFYTGDMGYGYGELLRDLLVSEPKRSCELLRLYGNYSQWNQKDVSAHQGKGVLFDAIPFDDLFQMMSGALALLVVSSFKAENAVYTRTSFPSKISSYTMTGRPIIFWAPEDSSPAKFCREHDAGELLTSADPRKVWDIIEKIQTDRKFEKDLCRKSAATFKKVFEPDKLQADFLLGLRSCLPD